MLILMLDFPFPIISMYTAHMHRKAISTCKFVPHQKGRIKVRLSRGFGIRFCSPILSIIFMGLRTEKGGIWICLHGELSRRVGREEKRTRTAELLLKKWLCNEAKDSTGGMNANVTLLVT